MEQKCGAFSGLGFVGQNADGVIGMLAMDDAGASANSYAQPLVADWDSAVRADFDGRAHRPDVGPPNAAGRGA